MHPAYGRRFYTHVLSDEANVEGLRAFFTQEWSVDGSFSDFLALLLPGTEGGVRMEISKNYWDEMGERETRRGSHRAIHARAACLEVGGSRP
jgi:hypothetical protein